MIAELKDEIKNLPQYLSQPEKWTSLLIDKYPPVIHRLQYKISDTRSLLLHKLYNCEGEHALMHSHSWPLAVKVIEGGYEMGVGFSNDRSQVPVPVFTSFVKPGDYYEMINSKCWHYTKCSDEVKYSYSILLIGPRERERLAQNNDPLSEEQIKELFDYFNKIINV